MWESVSTKDGSLISVDMILIDEMENLMHAVVRKHLVPRFKHRLTKGLIYELRNVKVALNVYPYRPLASNLRLLFLPATEVRKLGEDVASIPRHGFQFVDQAVLRVRADDVTTLSDIVGCLCGFGQLEVVGTGYRKRDIRIFTDYSVTSTITLWAGWRPYVIVVSSVTVKTYQGSLTFAITSGSQIYINPNVGHVSSIRERFSALSLKVIPIDGATVARIPPEEAMFINRMTVEALVNATCAGELKVDVVTLKATKTAINNHYGWYYVSYKSCVRKVVPKDGIYVCNTCAKPVDFPLTLFRVNVQVEDTTGSTTVVLFNAAIERLLDISAKKLINNMPPGDTSLPTKLQPLLGREFVFKLKLNKYNLVEGLQDYGVSAVYTPLAELESVHATGHLTHAGGYLMESLTDDDNVPEGDKKRKMVLSPVIKNVTENSGEGLSAINKDAAENMSGPVINDATGTCSGDP
ncbi:replication protein A 70 kDa DNA-binding subunit C-like isoform X2 [Apium graveolens]